VLAPVLLPRVLRDNLQLRGFVSISPRPSPIFHFALAGVYLFLDVVFHCLLAGVFYRFSLLLGRRLLI
jgi:hypothetical protein